MAYAGARVQLLRGAEDGRLLGVGEGEVGAEADHAGAGGGALAATEADAVLQLALEGRGHADDHEVRGGVQTDGGATEHGELQKDVSMGRGHELRDEGEEEQRGFGIQHFGENPLTKSAVGWSRGFHGHFGVARADHADAEPDEIRGAGVFNSVERDGGGGKNRGEAEGGGENVEESADKRAERRKNAFALSTGQAARQNVENARTGRDGQKQSGSEEKQQAMRVEHAEIVRAQVVACKTLRNGKVA